MVNFEGIEGIDLVSKEIYETSDVEDELEVVESVERRDSIEEELFDLQKSRSRFERNMIDGNTTDFSGRIDKLASYKTYTVKETTQNKLKRIYLELQELEDEIDNNEEPTEEVIKLKELYNKINKNAKDFNLNSLKIEYETGYLGESEKKSQVKGNAAEFEEVEKRITKIEKAIGFNFKSDSSIQSTLNDLFRKFKLLSNDENRLHEVNKAIDIVNSKLEKTLLSRKSASIKSEIDEEAKIDEVYKQFQSFANYEEEIQLITKRLESLHDLHIRTADSTNTIEEIDSTISSLKSDFAEWDKSLTKLETKLDDVAQAFKNAK